MFDTLHKLIRQLESMTHHHISISSAIDMMEANANTVDELVVINVIRESFNELLVEEHQWKTA